MDSVFWHERWKEGRIGFHQGDINPYLQAHWQSLGVAAGGTVFVPLCGKSRDMLWLREQGHKVLGVEIVPQAVEAFFAENDLAAEVSRQGAFTLWQSEGVKIFCGDFFALTAADVAEVAGVYDRASLIALPPMMRERYAEQLRAILPDKLDILLVTMDYPQAEMNGPPFAVSAQEVAALYKKYFDIQQVSAEDILAREPRFKEQGLTRLLEKVYLLRAR